MSKSLGQRRRPVGRDRHATAPTRSAGTSSPPSSRGTATASRSRRSARRSASSCSSCGTRTASTCCTRTPTRSPQDAAPATGRAQRARPLGAVASAGDGRDRHRAARRLRRDRRGPRDRGVRRRALELVRAPLAPALLGRRRRPRSRTLRDVPGHGRQAAGAVHAVPRRRDLRQPRRRRAERPPDRLPAAGRARSGSSSRRWRSRARRSASASRPAGQAKLKVRQPLRAAVIVATGFEREAIERLRRRRPRGAERARAALRLRGRRARRGRGQAELPDARPALRQADAAGRRRGRGARPGARRRRAARGPHGRDHRRRPGPRARRRRPARRR